MKPVLCLYANCQGEALARLLRQHPALQQHEFVVLKAWLNEQPSENVLARCELLIYQASFGEPDFLARLPERATRVRIPLLTCSFLWPYGFDCPDEPVGWRFPYGDRHLIAQLRQGATAEQAVGNYLSLDLATRLDMARLRDLEVQKWRRYDADTDVRMGAFMAEHALTQRLFFTPDHPTDVVMIELCNQLLALLGQPPFGWPSWQGYTHSLAGTELPVHPSLLRHFGIDWLPPTHRYPLFGGHVALDTAAYLARYAVALRAPSMADGLREAVAAIARQDDATALNLCTLINLRAPRQPWAMAALALVQALHGQRAEAAAQLLSALPADLSIH
jgi:hypothetical protein